jgi:hypothetical protein
MRAKNAISPTIFPLHHRSDLTKILPDKALQCSKGFVQILRIGTRVVGPSVKAGRRHVECEERGQTHTINSVSIPEATNSESRAALIQL